MSDGTHDVAVVFIYHPIREDVLFARRALDDDLWPGKWYVISEHLESFPDEEGKAVVEAAERGAREEVGLEIVVKGLLKPVDEFHYQGRLFRLHPVLARARHDKVRCNDELVNYLWLAPYSALDVLGKENIVEADRVWSHGNMFADMVHSATVYMQFLKRSAPARGISIPR